MIESNDLKELPRWEWPHTVPDRLLKVFRNSSYLVQVYQEPDTVRLTVNRVTINRKTRRWDADIPWEDLQTIKNACGYADFDAVEFYPREADVVNVANMRHLFILPEPHPLVWRDKQ